MINNHLSRLSTELRRADELLLTGPSLPEHITLRAFASLCTPADPKAPEAILSEIQAAEAATERSVELGLDVVCYVRAEETGAWAVQQVGVC